MLILHLNPNNYIATILGQFQESESVRVKTMGERSLPNGAGSTIDQIMVYLKDIKEYPDILHIHDLDLLTSSNSEKFLEEIRSFGKTKLVLSLGLEGFLSSAEIDSKLSALSSELIEKYFDLVLVHDGNLIPLGDKLSSSSWLPYPVSIVNSSTNSEFNIPQEEIIVQASFPKSSPEYDKCEEIVSQLREAGHQISLSPLASNGGVLGDKGEIFIDRLNGDGYGYLAILGLASGRTVLSANPAHVRKRSKQLEMSSVLDTNWGNLKMRLESLLNERRSLRDFSKRSKQYVENFHRGDLIAAELLEMYRQII